MAVATTATLRSVDAALSYSCALTASSQALCWGGNGGRLGNGNTTDSSMPVAVANGITFSSISSGHGHTCGVASDATLWCWGANGSGQLGVAAPAVAFGNHTCVISADRLTAYCFGRNDTGQLGNGATSTATAVNATPSIVVGQKPIG
jgi:alpha-tubulin suppressor-like RCC1 family protein